ncbi:allantoinase [Phanerochaete sordida]|uniref:allantoinase n=1 Tax=Phanerochaete sordida TaxID=48140 RepID=A0A9P3GMV5_9APHY|nr:allantoinase [Phanerochaete sordida]
MAESSLKRAFVSSNAVLPGQAEPQPATVLVDVSTGKIVDILPGRRSQKELPGVELIDVGDRFILPGLVDAHVHLNEPGRTDWEGFWTGTRAAISGGVTTVVDMPLNSIPPTTTVDNLEAKRSAAQGQCWSDVAFWGGVIPGNQSHLRPLIDAGIRGFKCFLIESGVEEFPCVTESDLVSAMDQIKDTPTVLCFHAELEKPESPKFDHHGLDQTAYSTFLDSRPEQLEVDAITLITSLHKRYPSLRLHIVHLSAASALPLIRAAKASGLPLTVETCFHYLALTAQDIPAGRPEFKCCPPIRGAANREALWDALRDGTVDCVVSDHSPCVASLKNVDTGDIMGAWGGISTLGLGLSLLWTEGRKRGVSIPQIVDWVCANTAKHAGLDGRKGQVAVGYDADLVIWDPEAEFKVTKEQLNFKNKLTPYEGLTLTGRVQQTFLRGRPVYDLAAGGFVDHKPVGQLL